MSQAHLRLSSRPISVNFSEQQKHLVDPESSFYLVTLAFGGPDSSFSLAITIFEGLEGEFPQLLSSLKKNRQDGPSWGAKFYTPPTTPKNTLLGVGSVYNRGEGCV